MVFLWVLCMLFFVGWVIAMIAGTVFGISELTAKKKNWHSSYCRDLRDSYQPFE